MILMLLCLDALKKQLSRNSSRIKISVGLSRMLEPAGEIQTFLFWGLVCGASVALGQVFPSPFLLLDLLHP